MKVYTFWCEYDLGINDTVYKEQNKLRKEVIKALSDCCMEESIQDLEDAGLFYINEQEI